MLEQLNAWLGDLFHRGNHERTVPAMLDSQSTGGFISTARENAESRLADAERRLRRFQEAIKAGVDPAALVESINEAQAAREAAQAELTHAPTSNALTDAEIHAMIDSLGDVGRALNSADPTKLQELYEKLTLEMTYDPDSRSVEVTVNPGRRDSVRVRGASYSLSTRLWLPEVG